MDSDSAHMQWACRDAPSISTCGVSGCPSCLALVLWRSRRPADRTPSPSPVAAVARVASTATRLYTTRLLRGLSVSVCLSVCLSVCVPYVTCTNGGCRPPPCLFIGLLLLITPGGYTFTTAKTVIEVRDGLRLLLLAQHDHPLRALSVTRRLCDDAHAPFQPVNLAPGRRGRSQVAERSDGQDQEGRRLRPQGASRAQD